MIIYLTYNDQPSGVYWSQVTNVVAHLNTLGSEKVRLVALVSGRDFFNTRKKIKAHSPSALVLPMIPQMKRWKQNRFTLAGVCRLLKPSGIICRGPFATWMALRMRERNLTKRVCYDGRGAYAAEWEEYRIIDDDKLIAEMRPIENDAVNASDFRIAVSNALVAHWRERYGYSGDAHTVIPCTLGTGEVARRSVDPLGRPNSAIRLVYSGSTAGWQSFELLEKLLTRIMDAQPDVHVLFLSERDAHNEALKTRYPGRVEVKWVAANEVADVLRSCDAGILVREDTITNRVASPTKFAEYLSAGIPVIISEHLGDFSALVAKEGLGMVIKDGAAILSLNSLPTAERERLSRFASGHFDKAAFSEAYRRLLECLAGSP